MMDVHRARELGIANLEFVFQPPGLPLVAKQVGGTPTTSIAVRGGPGAGKTTFALGLARAIALENSGFALYLTTEASPVELLHKARSFGLPDGTVHTSPEAPVGSVRVESVGTHVEELRSGDLLGVVEAAWQLAEQSKNCRVLVVDAVPLRGGLELASRDPTIEFVQALESRGITTILVEESEGTEGDFVPFVVDLVFEIERPRDPGTGKIVRRLACTKSRFPSAIAGPHDYGLEDDRPAVWPDPLRLSAVRSIDAVLVPKRMGPLVLPIPPDKLIHLDQGVVLVHESERQTYVQLLSANAEAPPIFVSCGPLTTIRVVGAPALTVATDEGLASLAWALLRLPANVVVIDRIDALVGRHGPATALQDLLTALARLGRLVCVTGSPETLKGFAPIANLDEVTRNVDGWRLQPLPRRPYLGAAKWFERGAQAAGVDDEGRLTALRAAVRSVDLVAVRNSLAILRGLPASPSTPYLWAVAATLALQAGLDSTAETFLHGYRDTVVPPLPAHMVWLARAFADHGELWSTTQLLVERFGSALTDDTVVAMWRALIARATKDEASLEVTLGAVDGASGPWIIDILLEALVLRGRLDTAREVAAGFAKGKEHPAWWANRLLVDARLVGSSDDAIEHELRALLQDGAAPSAPRAEVAFNLSLWLTARGRRAEGQAPLREALELNPALEVAQAEMATYR